MIIKVLIENTTDSELKSEHGLSLYIEYKDKRILLDAGSTESFAENAADMGVDLKAVDLAFLSHGHYDHGGGFGAFIKANDCAPVYAMENALESYASASGGNMHEIGVPKVVREVLQGRLVKVKGVARVAEGITVVPHSTPGLTQIGERAGLYREKESEWVPDDFTHEMSVVFETPDGLVICNSCSHGGLQNIVEEVKAVFPGCKVLAYVGGLHMKGNKDGEEICTFTAEEVKALTDFIKAEGIQMLITGHCTGAPAIELLNEKLDAGILLEMCSGRCFPICEESCMIFGQ